MVTSLSAGGLTILVAALLAAGLLTGFLSGLLGIGGGGILVPVLYEVFSALDIPFDIRMHVTLGTAIAVVAPTTFRSFRGHMARGTTDAAVLRRLGPWMVVGVLLGILTVKASSTELLQWLWVAFGTTMGLKMALGRDDWRLGNALPLGVGAGLFTMAVGFVSVLLSIAGAAFMVTFMTLYGRPLLQAVGTSAGFGPLIAIPGVIGYVWAGWGVPGTPPLSLGYVSLLGAAVIIPASFLAVPWGVKVAHGISRRRLELAFAAFLAVVVARFLVDLLG
jgi:uncharacterized membrane protein YfcA